ncbi:MAG: YceI family protein [Flavobacteriales bacterium]
MKKHVFTLLITLFGINLLNAQNNSDNLTSITFEVSNMGFNTVNGSFSGMTGAVNVDPNNIISSKIDVCIPANSVNTGNNGRDKHLKKDDFFDVEKYPNICFVSNSVTKNGDKYIVKGNLTLKDVTKEISIPMQIENNQLIAEFKLTRKDFNLGPNGGFMVGKTIDIKVETTLL